MPARSRVAGTASTPATSASAQAAAYWPQDTRDPTSTTVQASSAAAQNGAESRMTALRSRSTSTRNPSVAMDEQLTGLDG